jgi:3-oxoacyl-[acyl-carrier protein] reductase
VRNVIVTGASRGIGLAVARSLVADGFRVVAIARSQSPALAAAMREEGGEFGPGALHFRRADLADIAAIPRLVAAIREELGPIFGLVNNAGVGTHGVLTMTSDEQIAQLVRLNTLSPILMSKYVVRAMMAQRADDDGRIVNIASIAGLTGFRGIAAYSATKASLIGFTRSLAREVGSLGITVNAVAPGFVDTDMTEGMEQRQRDRVVKRSALHRLAGVRDVADAVAYLISDKARSITGTVITVDAGSTA